MNGFIEKIERLRNEHGYTHLQVSMMLGGNNESYYRNRVRGRCEFNVKDIKALIALYHLNSEEIADLFE